MPDLDLIQGFEINSLTSDDVIYVKRRTASPGQKGKWIRGNKIVGSSVNVFQALTDGATITWDMSLGNKAYVEINGTRTLVITNPVNLSNALLRVKHKVAGTTLILSGNSDGVGWTQVLNGVTALCFDYDATLGFLWCSNIPPAVAGDTQAPVLVTATISNSLRTRIVLAFNETLSSTITFATTDFTVPGKTVTAVARSGNYIFIDVNIPFTSADTPTFSGGNNKIMDLIGNVNTTNFTNQAITNNISPYNNTEATDYFASLATAGYTATGTEKTAFDTFVSSAKTNGYWTKLKALWLYLGGTSSPALLNAISSNYTPTVVGTVTFGAGGMTTDGSTGYLRTGLVPSSVFPGLNGTFGGALLNNLASTGVMIGAIQDANHRMEILPRYTDGNCYGTMFKNGAGASSGSTDSSGRWALDRTSDHSLILSRNGVAKSGAGTVTSIETGSGAPNIELYIGASNNAGTATSFYANTFKSVHVADGLTSTERAAYDTDIATFLTAIGR